MPRLEIPLKKVYPPEAEPVIGREEVPSLENPGKSATPVLNEELLPADVEECAEEASGANGVMSYSI
ncbi:hypothetical protein N7454_004610 [Penicillium verhagenii]|nr:hypothetical protein N7454_004973 [Penicillium verhagenii]KAJ5938268.1 hypothetical protein N7454_004610 [Penicillium verhagenii]